MFRWRRHLMGQACAALLALFTLHAAPGLNLLAEAFETVTISCHCPKDKCHCPGHEHARAKAAPKRCHQAAPVTSINAGRCSTEQQDSADVAKVRVIIGEVAGIVAVATATMGADVPDPTPLLRAIPPPSPPPQHHFS